MLNHFVDENNETLIKPVKPYTGDKTVVPQTAPATPATPTATGTTTTPVTQPAPASPATRRSMMKSKKAVQDGSWGFNVSDTQNFYFDKQGYQNMFKKWDAEKNINLIQPVKGRKSNCCAVDCCGSCCANACCSPTCCGSCCYVASNQQFNQQFNTGFTDSKYVTDHAAATGVV